MRNLYQIAVLLTVVALPAALRAQGNETFPAAARVGIEIEARRNNVVITQVYENSSAAAEKLEVGDQLLRVDQVNVVGLKARRVEPMLRGSPGSRLQLTVLPRMQMLPRTVTVLRDIQDDPGGDISTVDAIRNMAAQVGSSDRVQKIRVDRVDVDHRLSRAEVVDRLHSTTDDVLQCVQAVIGYPDNDDGAFEVRYSMKGKGYVGVRLDPIDVDVQVCIAAKASRWQLPQPEKPPANVTARYVIPRAPADQTKQRPAATETESPPPVATPSE